MGGIRRVLELSKGRAFCLFTILGSHSRRVPGALKANDLVRGMSIR